MTEHKKAAHPVRTSTVSLLKQTQKYSAFGIMGFAAMHLTSTVLLPPLNISLANQMFMTARSVYQSYLGEWALVYGSFGLHLLSGFLLRVVRTVGNYQDTGNLKLPKVSSVSKSGFILSVLATTHFLSTRYGPQQALGDSSLISLEYITYCLNVERLPVTIAMVLLTTLYTAHAGAGAKMYFGTPRPGKLVLAAVAGLTLLSCYMIGAQPVPTGWIFSQYELAHDWLKNAIFGTA